MQLLQQERELASKEHRLAMQLKDAEAEQKRVDIEVRPIGQYSKS